MPTSTTRVALVLEGDNADVMDVVSLALAGGVIVSMEQHAVVASAADELAARRSKLPEVAVGDRVVARVRNSMYGITKGDVGVVGVMRGKQAPIIRWENGREARCAISLLTKIS